MTQSSTFQSGRPLMIICPTSQGGHIEHAFDLAVAGKFRTGQRTVLATRPGARAYLPIGADKYVDIREDLRPLQEKRICGRKIRQFVDLIHEHVVLRRLVKNLRPVVVLSEEPRYPWPRLLLPRRVGARLTLILHNVVEHDEDGKGFLAGLIRRAAVVNASSVVVHGTSQEVSFRSRWRRSVVGVDLPKTSPASILRIASTDMFEAGPSKSRGSYLCLGEIRRNKGIEVAINAARISGSKLAVVGRSIDDEYLIELRALASGAANVTIDAVFLSAPQFQVALLEARAIVLPYLRFDAQSGPLSRAIESGVPVLASRVPALEEQAGDYARVRFFEPGAEDELALLMTEFSTSNSVRPSNHSADDTPSDAQDEEATLARAASSWDRVLEAALP